MKTYDKRKVRNIILLNLTLILLLASCNNVVETMTNSSTSQIEKSNTPSSTPPQTDTVRNTLTITPTNPMFPTRTPAFTREESDAYFLDLYQQKSDCELPCVWGLNPGISTESDIKEVLYKLDLPQEFHTENITELSFGFDVPIFDENCRYSFLQITIWMQEGKVSYISIPSCHYNIDFDYSLSGILQKYGVPDEIIVEPFVYDWEFPMYALQLIYFTKGILINYGGFFEVQEHELEICKASQNNLSDSSGSLILFTPSNDLTFEEIYEDIDFYDPEVSYSLDEIAFGYDPKDFYTQFSVPESTGCIALDEEAFVDVELMND